VADRDDVGGREKQEKEAGNDAAEEYNARRSGIMADFFRGCANGK